MADILSLNQLISQRAHENPDLHILAIPDKDFNVRLRHLLVLFQLTGVQYVRHTIYEIDAAASLLANHLKDTGALPGRDKGDATSKLTVGLLGVSNVEYVIAEIALYRMGYCSSVSAFWYNAVPHSIA